MKTDPATIALLERIAVAVERLAGQRSAPDAGAVLLLRAIWSAIGDEQFTAGRVIDLAASPMRAALAAAVAGRGVKSIGKQLSLLVGDPIGGLRLQRIGRSRPGVYRLSASESRESLIGNPWHV